MNATQRSHHQGAVQSGRQSLTYYVAHIKTDQAIGQAKEIDEVATYLKERSEAESDLDGRIAEGCRGNERFLNESRFSDVVVADASAARHIQFVPWFGVEEVEWVQGAAILWRLDRHETN